MSLPIILQRAKSLGYKVFEGDADYDLNIIGVRSKDNTVNVFNDLLTVTFKVKGQWHTRSFTVTTDPGLYWMQNPMRVTGCAQLCLGQYRGAYKIGKHRGQYNALVQTGAKVKIFRDPDKNETFDQDSETISEGHFGINIHRASYRRTSKQVDKWSAGCQVFADPDEFAEFMKLCNKQVSVNGWESFTYTLLEEW